MTRPTVAQKREAGGAQSPAAADVAEVVDVEVDAGEADQSGQRDARRDDRGRARHPRPQAQHDRHRDPDVEDRVGGVAARERGARSVDQPAVGPRPVDRVLDLVEADRSQRHPRQQDSELGPAAAGGQQRRAERRQHPDEAARTEEGDDLGDAGEPAGFELFDQVGRGLVAGRRAGVAPDHDDVGDDDEERDGERRHQRGEFEPEGAAGGDPVPEEPAAAAGSGGRARRASASPPVPSIQRTTARRFCSTRRRR